MKLGGGVVIEEVNGGDTKKKVEDQEGDQGRMNDNGKMMVETAGQEGVKVTGVAGGIPTTTRGKAIDGGGEEEDLTVVMKTPMITKTPGEILTRKVVMRKMTEDAGGEFPGRMKKKREIMMTAETGEEEIGKPGKIQKRRRTAGKMQGKHGANTTFH